MVYVKASFLKLFMLVMGASNLETSKISYLHYCIG